MRLTILGSLILTVAAVAFANENILTNVGEMMDPSIVRIFPRGQDANEKIAAQGSGTNAVSISLKLLSKAKESFRQSPKGNGEERDSVAAYRVTWRQCLLAMKESKDQTAQRLVLDEWNKCLREDDDAVPSQIYALSELWDRNLLTDDFWQLLERTRKKKTIKTIAYVLYEHGNASDAEKLLKKRKSGIEIDSQEIIQNAINWMSYRLSSDKSNPGPAAVPPRAE